MPCLASSLQLALLGKSIKKFTSKVIAMLVNSDLEIKRVCYILLSEISKEAPDCDELLMCISPLHKLITGTTSAILKGDSLKTLCSLSIGEVRPMLISTLQRLHVDKSPYVKKIAALALLESHAAEEIETHEVITFYSFLMRDQPIVRGLTLQLLNEVHQIASDNQEFLHFYFRRVCKEIHTYTSYDVSQVLAMLHRYALVYLKEEQRRLDNDEEHANDNSSTVTKTKIKKKTLNEDIQLLQSACLKMLYSTHPAIILEAAHIIAVFPTPESLAKVTMYACTAR